MYICEKYSVIRSTAKYNMVICLESPSFFSSSHNKKFNLNLNIITLYYNSIIRFHMHTMTVIGHLNYV